MGFVNWIKSRIENRAPIRGDQPTDPDPTWGVYPDALLLEGSEVLEVECRFNDDYQANLRKALASTGKDVQALLVAESGSPLGPDNIAVYVGGDLVGRLADAVATDIRAGLLRLIEENEGFPVALRGHISDAAGSNLDMEIFLRYDPEQFGAS